MAVLASKVAASTNNSMASASWSSSFKCSARMPDKPRAPPCFASRNTIATDPAACRTFSYAESSAGIGERGCGGRRCGSVNARHTASVPGASSAAVSGPVKARPRRLLHTRIVPFNSCLWAEERCRNGLALRMSGVHSPRWKGRSAAEQFGATLRALLRRPCQQHTRHEQEQLPGPGRSSCIHLAAGPAATAARRSLRTAPRMIATLPKGRRHQAVPTGDAIAWAAHSGTCVCALSLSLRRSCARGKRWDVLGSLLTFSVG